MQHREKLEEMKREAIASIPCQRSHYKMYYDCPCGSKQIIVKNLQFHFCSTKHRAACGDLGGDAK